MKDIETLLSETQKPEFSNTQHKNQLRRALLNSNEFKKKNSFVPKLIFSLSTGAVLAAVALTVVLAGPGFNGNNNSGDQQTPKLASGTSANQTQPQIIAQNNQDEEFILGSIRKFKSEEDLQNYLGEYKLLAEGSGGGSGGDTFSVTNNQVKNVDEADIVKTDGQYIYTAKQDGKVSIFEAYPAEKMKKVSEINAVEQSDDAGYVSQPDLFIYNDSLIVLTSQESEPFKNKAYSSRCGFLSTCPGDYTEYRTYAHIYNITDRANPVLSNTVSASGFYDDARMINGYVYFVADQYIGEQYILPSVQENNDEFVVKAENIFYNSDIRDQNEFTFSNIVSVNILTGDATSQVSLASRSEELYVSGENIYTTYVDWDSVYAENANGDDIRTTVNKITIDKGAVAYVASAQVKGWVESQFSLDEFEGNLRIATTTGNNWDENSIQKNHLYVLDKNLEQVGALENIAPDERIYAVRFAGDRGYVVTYKEVDPLFVLDLGNPRQPVILGQLKIPGYSDYLHPYDENHLIGIGKDTEMVTRINENGEESRVEVSKGLKMSMFDVTDVTNPKEMYTEIIGEGSAGSTALYEHKSFLFDKEKELLAMPVTLFEKREGDEYETRVFDGAVVYRVNLQSGFTLAGKVSQYTAEEMAEFGNGGFGPDKSISRILYIDDYLYTVSYSNIAAYKLWELQELYLSEL